MASLLSNLLNSISIIFLKFLSHPNKNFKKRHNTFDDCQSPLFVFFAFVVITAAQHCSPTRIGIDRDPCKYFSGKNASETRLTCVQNAKNERVSSETIIASGWVQS
jgi:hypothetical protein